MRLNVLLIALLVVATTAFAEDCSTPMLEFEIEDQFKEKHTHEEFAGKTTVLIWSDRESSKFVDEWGIPLREALKEDVVAGTLNLRAVAHVKGVPFFVKGKVRGRFNEDPKKWALLDWKGKFREAYDPVENQVNLFVFDREGCLVDQLSGVELSDDDLARFVAGVRAL